MIFISLNGKYKFQNFTKLLSNKLAKSITHVKNFSTNTDDKKVKIIKASNYMKNIIQTPNPNVMMQSKNLEILNIDNNNSSNSNDKILKTNKESDVKEEVEKFSTNNTNSLNDNKYAESTFLVNNLDTNSETNSNTNYNESNVPISFGKIKISFDIFDESNKASFTKIIRHKPEVSLVILEKNLNTIFLSSDFSSKLALNTNFSIWLEHFNTFISHVVFYPNKFDLFPKYKEILHQLSRFLIENEDNFGSSDTINQLLINFISNKIREIQYPDTIFIFHFFYTLLLNLFQDKNLISTLKNLNGNINNRDDMLELLKIRSIQTPTSLIKNLLEHFPYSIKDFNPIKNEIHEICELVIIYQYYYFKLKGTNKDSFSMMMSNFDEMIAKFLENNLKSDLFHYLTLGFIKIKQPGFNYMLLPNIYSVLCKKFNLEQLTDQHGYIFIHSKFIRDYFKECQTSKTLTALILSNIFYLGDCLRNKKMLMKINNELIIHLIYIFTQVRYEIDKELLEEINERLMIILNDFNFSQIHTLVASLSMIEENNKQFHPFFKKILTHEKMEKMSSKYFLNIGFYISMTKLDDINAWSKWFQNFNKKTFRFNDFDCKMLKDLKKNLEVMVGQEYAQFSKIYNKEGNNLKNVSFQRWFYAKDLGNYSNSDVMVLKYLRKFNLKFSTQIVIADMFLCDFVLGDKIILELNGPHHYYCTNLLKLEHKAKFKKEFLEKLGYYVVCVNIITINKFSKIGVGAEIMNIVKASVPEEEFNKIYKS